jgi:DUF4097 and DUF4098 domain-containing protein YvlB
VDLRNALLTSSLLQTPQHTHSDWPRRGAQLTWSIHATIPANKYVSAFDANMPNSVQVLNLDDLTFGNLTLQTSNAPIQLEVRPAILALIYADGIQRQNVEAKTVDAHTSNGPISADIRADTVSLKTSNSLIKGDVSARSLLSHTSNGPITGHFVGNSSVVLKTSNSVIQASVTIHNQDRKAPSSVELHTSNG